MNILTKAKDILFVSGEKRVTAPYVGRRPYFSSGRTTLYPIILSFCLVSQSPNWWWRRVWKQRNVWARQRLWPSVYSWWHGPASLCWLSGLHWDTTGLCLHDSIVTLIIIIIIAAHRAAALAREVTRTVLTDTAERCWRAHPQPLDQRRPQLAQSAPPWHPSGSMFTRMTLRKHQRRMAFQMIHPAIHKWASYFIMIKWNVNQYLNDIIMKYKIQNT